MLWTGSNPGSPIFLLCCFDLLFLFPLAELPLPFLALKKFLYLRGQDPRQSLHLVEWDADAVVVGFLFCQALSSIRYVI